MAEYAEIIGQHMGETQKTSGCFRGNPPNVEFITTYFKFQLLRDEDDNKFVDCAVAANASFIVSHDRDFKILDKIDFPKVRVIDTKEFQKIIER
ncbi:MAG: putative toxin-antitoxin system toxin component, PIN family [Saprospiraceae bacterium]